MLYRLRPFMTKAASHHRGRWVSSRHMFRKKRRLPGILPLIFVGFALAQTPEPEKTPKELLEFVKNARSMGLGDDAIHRGAVQAGWSPDMIGQALSIAEPRNTSAASAGMPPKSLTLPPDYRIGSGDVLQIVVWKEPDASVPGVVVRSDGKISVPLLKEVYVRGMTPMELEKMLTEKLKNYVLSADVTVVPRDINSLKIYMIGGVRKEGPVAMTAPMTVLQAITEAGGLSEYAKTKKIYVLRNQDGRQVRFPFDYKAVIKGERIEQNIMLMPDDMVVVPR
jgi:polysaccharide export outer membrane protein